MTVQAYAAAMIRFDLPRRDGGDYAANGTSVFMEKQIAEA
jgi:hypothetical protein